jgi:hypothetical protein
MGRLSLAKWLHSGDPASDEFVFGDLIYFACG